jgi:uncharacterized protein YebE (UPF0316 family)
MNCKSDRLLYLVFIIAGLVSFGVYVVASYNHIGEFGYPLDDAWIHQTYARNLAHYGEFSFIPGKTSGGSTAPLWTGLLAVFHLLGSAPFLGTFFVSFILFLTAAFCFQQLAVRLMKSEQMAAVNRSVVFGFGIFFVLEWHMIWASLSGMEILLYIVFFLFAILFLAKDKNYLLIGFFSGIIVWVRPDGLTLLGPIMFTIILSKKRHEILPAIGKFIAGWLPVVVGYLVFNFQTAGTLFPNTFYAKQAEYAVLFNQPLLSRFSNLLLQPFIGAAILLVPGIIFELLFAIKNKRWLEVALFLWAVGYIGIYAVRLPVTYQHGRYMMPAMPVFFLLGLLGTWRGLSTMRLTERTKKLIHFGVTASISLLTVGFWWLGMKAYRDDVAIIHEEMVETVRWIQMNLPDDAYIAAHDIGALGYYGKRDIYDLAGLISPEVIPVIRDEEALIGLIEKSGAEYLMTFPDWYNTIMLKAHLIYQSEGETVRLHNHANMAVYQYNWTEKDESMHE